MKRYRVREGSIAFFAIFFAKVLTALALLYIFCVLGFAL